MAKSLLRVRVALSPDTEALIAAFERGVDAVLAAGLNEWPEVRACLADIQHRGCMAGTFDGALKDGVFTVWLVDEVLLGHFARFQGYAHLAAAANRARHEGRGG